MAVEVVLRRYAQVEEEVPKQGDGFRVRGALQQRREEVRLRGTRHGDCPATALDFRCEALRVGRQQPVVVASPGLGDHDRAAALQVRHEVRVRNPIGFQVTTNLSRARSATKFGLSFRKACTAS